MGDEINIEKYRDQNAPKAVRAITKEMAAFLFPKKDDSQSNGVFNNEDE